MTEVGGIGAQSAQIRDARCHDESDSQIITRHALEVFQNPLWLGTGLVLGALYLTSRVSLFTAALFQTVITLAAIAAKALLEADEASRFGEYSLS